MIRRNTILGRAENFVFQSLRIVLIILTATMVLAVIGQVFSRYALHSSFSWSEELARLCMISIVFLGAALLVRRHDHLAVTSLVDLLPDRLWHVARALACAVGLYCCSYLLRGSWNALTREWSQTTPALQLSFGLIYSVIFAGIVLMALWLALNFVAHTKGSILNEARDA